MSYIIGYILIPCRIKMYLSLRLGSDGILPLPCRYKVSAGKTDCRYACGLQGIDNIPSKALLVCCGMLRIVHKSVYHSTDRL